MTEEVEALALSVGVTPACGALSLPRSTFYRYRAGAVADASAAETVTTTVGVVVESLDVSEAESAPQQSPRRSHPRALSDEHKRQLLEECSTVRFIDRSPAQIVATLLDEQRYLASERTIYRYIGANAPLRDRRHQRRHPAYAAPQLVAAAPNQVWSWDITRLKGPCRGASYQLYVILDIYSRYVVGWAVHERESEVLACQLIETICRRQKIDRGQLVVHADRGSAMRSHEVAALLDRLGVGKSHSRPYCSNDNPYSESQFKTLKYAPEFPRRFGSIEDARAFCRRFFKRYNREHHHSGIAMLTPSQVHHGEAETIIARRDATLAAAYQAHPERFVKGVPRARRLPEAAWINKPQETAEERGGIDEPLPVVNPQRPEGSHGGGSSTGNGDQLCAAVESSRDPMAFAA